jgi:uncharacterized membrane protein YgcG
VGIICGVALVVGACGQTDTKQASNGSSSSSDITKTAPTTKPHHHKRKHHKRKHRNRTAGLPIALPCPPPARTLTGVYHPARLVVLRRCQTAIGTVTDVRHEEDGDLHVILRLDPRYVFLRNADNVSQQHGGLVVEYMARDGGHLPEPTVGQRLVLTGAWVLDTAHGWRELHPVFRVTSRGRSYYSGPRFGGSPPGVGSSEAAGACHTERGSRCRGYSGSSDSSGGGSSSGSSGSGCAAGYSPCLPIVGDLNCSDIPASKKPVTVTGADPYNLDGDSDGIGCESG